MEDRFMNEINHLLRFKKVLDHDEVLPVRLEIKRLSLDFRHFRLTIRGLQSLVKNPSVHSSPTADVFVLEVRVPPSYPWDAIPDFRFQNPVPFHPHIWPNGRICWGTSTVPQPDLALADWVRAVIEYLQYNQDPGSALRINPDSPANPEALRWWQQNRNSLRRYVPPIDMGRLRRWVDQTRG